MALKVSISFIKLLIKISTRDSQSCSKYYQQAQTLRTSYWPNYNYNPVQLIITKSAGSVSFIRQIVHRFIYYWIREQCWQKSRDIFTGMEHETQPNVLVIESFFPSSSQKDPGIQKTSATSTHMSTSQKVRWNFPRFLRAPYHWAKLFPIQKKSAQRMIIRQPLISGISALNSHHHSPYQQSWNSTQQIADNIRSIFLQKRTLLTSWIKKSATCLVSDFIQVKTIFLKYILSLLTPADNQFASGKSWEITSPLNEL